MVAEDFAAQKLTRVSQENYQIRHTHTYTLSSMCRMVHAGWSSRSHSFTSVSLQTENPPSSIVYMELKWTTRASCEAHSKRLLKPQSLEPRTQHPLPFVINKWRPGGLAELSSLLADLRRAPETAIPPRCSPRRAGLTVNLGSRSRRFIADGSSGKLPE